MKMPRREVYAHSQSKMIKSWKTSYNRRRSTSIPIYKKGDIQNYADYWVIKLISSNNIYTLSVVASKFSKHTIEIVGTISQDKHYKSLKEVCKYHCWIRNIQHFKLDLQWFSAPRYVINIRNYTNYKLITVDVVVWKLTWNGLFYLVHIKCNNDIL